MSFSDLKRKSQNNFQFLQKELEKSSTEQKSGADERLWKPELDASGNGYAVLRFLPAPEGSPMRVPKSVQKEGLKSHILGLFECWKHPARNNTK